MGKGYNAYRLYALEELHDAAFQVYLCDDEELDPAAGALVRRAVRIDFSRPPAEEADRVAGDLDGVGFARGVCYIESLLPWAAEFLQRLGVPYIDPAKVHRVRSKYAMRQAFAEAGLPTPWHRLGKAAELLAADIPFPAVVKPEEGYSSIGVELVESREHLREYFARDNNVRSETYLLEGVLRGREYSVEGYIRDGEPVATGLTCKFKTPLPFFEELGQYCSREIGVTGEQRALFDAAARAMGIDSTVFHFEFVSDGDVLTPIEIGARLGGDKIPYLHRRATGRSLLLDFLDRPVAYPMTPQEGVGIVFFVPRESGVVPAAFEPELCRDELGESFIECTAGKVVRTAPDDFFARLGFAVVNAGTIEDFVVLANERMALFERRVGIALHRLELDPSYPLAGSPQ